MDQTPLIWILCVVLCHVSILKYSFGADTLFPDQTLADKDVLVSPGQLFELGFFSPGKSTTKFLGIWYKATPDVVVWVANRGNPIMGTQGNLTLSRNVLSDNSSNIWQSFDYPSDTRLPGMKMGESQNLTSWKSPDDPSAGAFVYGIENNGLPQTTIFTETGKLFRTGPWNGIYFTGLPIVPDVNKVKTEFNNGRLISLFIPSIGSNIVRLTMNYSGLLQTHAMNEQRDGWIVLFSSPDDRCESYGLCGPHSICRSYTSPPCGCFRGFMPKSQKEWSGFNWSNGCHRNVSLDCRKEDGFLKFDGIKSPDTLNFRLETSMSVDECHNECLNNCSCTAYAAPYLINQTNGCLMWFGDLIDVKEFTGEVTNGPSIYIRVPISVLDSSKRKGDAKTVLIAVIVSVGVFVLICIGGIIFRIRRRRQGVKEGSLPCACPTSVGSEGGMPSLCYIRSLGVFVPSAPINTLYLVAISAATNNFSHENILGEDGFGPVYKGYLSAEQLIAVKRMSRTSKHGPQEFKNEVTLIAKLQHRNLVRILGCCIEAEENMLIYEYLQNKSLDYFIFDKIRCALLNWPKRFDIIKGIARGLLYLHQDSRLKIIHRDLKVSNILLDENMNAKISDFGLARMFEGDQTTARTNRVVGTYGYMAPEYVFNGKFSIKSDIFSMGVVILEIVSGKKSSGFKQHSNYQNLLEQAWVLWKEKREMELMDPCYNSSYVELQVMRCIQIGLLCVQNAADDRPEMPYVLLMLSSENSVMPEPKKPGFFLHSSSPSSQRNESGSEEMRSFAITTSDVEAR
ncbi:hypothetical protein ACS0TY_017558 [Phlomoides rotata]